MNRKRYLVADVLNGLSLFVGSIVLFICVYKLKQAIPTPLVNQYYIYLSITLTVVLGNILLFFGNKDLRVNAILVGLSCVFGLYAFEGYLSYMTDLKIRESRANKLGVPFDSRNKSQVIKDFQSEGIEAVPAIFPYVFISSGGLVTHDGQKNISISREFQTKESCALQRKRNLERDT